LAAAVVPVSSSFYFTGFQAEPAYYPVTYAASFDFSAAINKFSLAISVAVYAPDLRDSAVFEATVFEYSKLFFTLSIRSIYVKF
jgi:hypothetical protein